MQWKNKKADGFLPSAAKVLPEGGLYLTFLTIASNAFG